MPAKAITTRTRGRLDKRRAILRAAFTVFAERGYAQACVQEIADRAGVAKPTVYNHLTDKETLFRNAVVAVAEEVAAENLALLDGLRVPGDDLRHALEEVALGMVTVCHGERSRSLRRLTHAQVGVFPDLVEAVQQRTSDGLAGALADRLARLVLSGHLRTCDPAQAAEQFLALLTAPLEARSRLGTREIGAEQLRTVAGAAVDTFLRAYAAPDRP